MHLRLGVSVAPQTNANGSLLICVALGGFLLCVALEGLSVVSLSLYVSFNP